MKKITELAILTQAKRTYGTVNDIEPEKVDEKDADFVAMKDSMTDWYRDRGYEVVDDELDFS